MPCCVTCSAKKLDSLSNVAVLQSLAGHWSLGARWWVIAFVELVGFFLSSLCFSNSPYLDLRVFHTLASSVLGSVTVK